MTDELAALSEADIDRYGEDDGWTPVAGYGDRLSRRTGAHYAFPRDRADGRLLPYYETEMDLARMRQTARLIEAASPLAEAVRKILRGYVVGKGFTFKAKVKAEALPEGAQAPEWLAALVKSVQRFLDQFGDRNRLKARVADSQWLSRVDGEYPTAAYLGLDGLPEVRTIDPGCVTEPGHAGRLNDWLADEEGQDRRCCWLFGVRSPYDEETGQNLTADPLGYHVVYDDAGRHWDYIPRDRMELFRRNVPVEAKRGVSSLYKVAADLEREAKLNRNSAEGMSILSAIAYIKKLAKPAMGAPGGMLGGDVMSRVRTTQDGGSRTVQRQRFWPGTIVTLSDADYAPSPLAQMNTGALRDVMNAIVRRAGICDALPGWMLTGDTESALYSAVLAMGSPFVNACEEEQEFLKDRWLALHWKALRLVPCQDWFGMPLEVVERWVEIEATAPSVALTDTPEQATKMAAQIGAGILSKQTACEEGGRDWATEKQRMAQERAEAPAVLPAAPPQPQPGQPASLSALGEGMAREVFQSLKLTEEYP